MGYVHPYRDTDFILQQVLLFDSLCSDAGIDVNSELASAILEEAAKLGSAILDPLNRSGDVQGVTLGENGVEQAAGFKEAYQQFAQGGWVSLTAPEAFGGQALPNVISTAVCEIWNATNLSFALCPLLSQGAIESLIHHGSVELQQTFLPKLIAGEWTGTMNLTEPDAGSDLAAIKTKAEPEGEHYRLSGQKIFITWGDHQMAENIIHLVLARLPNAPAGVKGISLFIVPKFLLDTHGHPTTQNHVHCLSVEHKLGIHASPTCVMEFKQAQGYLVGEPHNGLTYMFTMMNAARQAVGLQGLAISERAYQQAKQFAKERVQGTRRDGTRIPIIQHPDVRRMLMLMKSGTEAMRALALTAAVEIDQANYASDATQGAKHTARVELYTPIVKGWLTELAQEITSLGVQIHGGMGFIEETGAAQYLRDARILPIYEGTNGIQAMDLVGRKMLANDGHVLQGLLEDIAHTVEDLQAYPSLPSVIQQQLSMALQAATQARNCILNQAIEQPHFANGVSVNFLMLMGYLCGGWLMAKSALAAQALLDQQQGEMEFLQAKQISTRFYCEHFLPRTQACLSTILAGSDSIMAMPEAQF